MELNSIRYGKANKMYLMSMKHMKRRSSNEWATTTIQGRTIIIMLINGLILWKSQSSFQTHPVQLN